MSSLDEGRRTGLTLDRGRYYFVLNVPKHLYGKVLGRSGQPVRQVRQALRTADGAVAKRKAFELKDAKPAKWQLLDMGDEVLADQRYEAAMRIAERDYFPSDALLSRSFQDILKRMQAAAGAPEAPDPSYVTDAFFGGVPPALPPLRAVMEEHFALTKTKHLRKSDKQRHLRRPRARAVSHFGKAVPQRSSSHIDRSYPMIPIGFLNHSSAPIAAGAALRQ